MNIKRNFLATITTGVLSVFMLSFMVVFVVAPSAQAETVDNVVKLAQVEPDADNEDGTDDADDTEPAPAPPPAPSGESSAEIRSPLPLGAVTLPALIGRVISGFLGITGIVALIMFIYAGVTMMTAQGNPQKFDQGKKTMFWAGIGLVGIFSAYAAIRFVIESLGADTFTG